MSAAAGARGIAAGVVVALLAGLVAVGLLHALPFLSRLGALGSGGPTDEEWAGFVTGAFTLGSLGGLTSIVPSKGARFAAGAALLVLAWTLMAGSALTQTARSLTTGDSVIALILLSPFLLAAGLAIFLLAGALLVGLVIGAAYARAALEPRSRPVLGAAFASAALVAGLVMRPSLVALAVTAPTPRPTPTETTRFEPPPLAVCSVPPFGPELASTPLVSARKMLDSEGVVLLYVTIDQPDWTPSNMLDAAASALHDMRSCRDGLLVWTPRVEVATPRSLTVRVRAKLAPGADRRFQEQRLQSRIVGSVASSLRPDPDAPEFFVGMLDGAVPAELLGCEPPAPEVICEGTRISVRVAGAVPRIDKVQIAWGRGT